MTFEPKVAVVVPSNRPACLADWRAAWQPYLDGHDLIMVLDEPETWSAIEARLGQDAWIIPRQTDCVRMWGFLQAKWRGADIIITMDDDCYPDDPADAIREHVHVLHTLVEPLGWSRTVPDLMTRGLPRQRMVMANHGLWTQVPDVSGADQLAGYRQPAPYPAETILPPGHAPLSGMNWSMPTWALPAYYMGLMGHHLVTGEPWGVDRYGDIWGGLGLKRIADHMGYAVRSGTPFVAHQRASDPVVNEQRERAGVLRTPEYAHALASAVLPASLYPANHAGALADAVARLGTDYWRTYSRAWHRWIELTR